MAYDWLHYNNTERFLYVPQVRALLDTIASVEVGGGDEGMNGYNMLHGQVMARTGGGFDSYEVSDHPYVADPSLDAYYNPRVGQYSTPAGRYQIVKTTWLSLKDNYNFGEAGGFDPMVQDLAGIVLADGRDNSVQKLADSPDPSDQLLSEVYTSLRPEWEGIALYLDAEGFTKRYRGLFAFWIGQSDIVDRVAQLHTGEWQASSLGAFDEGGRSRDPNSVDNIDYTGQRNSGVETPDFQTLPEIEVAAMERLDVRLGEESAPLFSRPAPIEGEIDIGDLRFGSELIEDGSISGQAVEIDRPELNQPTGMTQQNASSIGLVSTLRTETDGVIGDGDVLPEVTITLNVNATYRDDVNRVLRPLIAMQKRSPFVPVRNHDVARLMLGISPTDSVIDYLNEENSDLVEQMSESEVRELEAEKAADAWIPTTIRSVDIRHQPGGRDYFRVHITLMYANVQPYVPRLQYWEKTTDALLWARYIGYRSHQGFDVQTQAGGSASGFTPEGNPIQLNQPSLAGQLDDPNRSYVFKKFYKGLLDEYQGPGYRRAVDRVRTLRSAADRDVWPAIDGREEERPLEPGEESELSVLLQEAETYLEETYPPIGYSTDGEPIYEPAYPISDGGRAFEPYDPDAEFGLSYVSASNLNTRSARRQDMKESFDERSATLDLMNAVAENYGRRDSFDDFVPSLGDVSAWTFSLGRDVTTAFRAVGYTIDTLTKRVEDVVAQLDGTQNDNFQLADYRLQITGEEDTARVEAIYDGDADLSEVDGFVDELNSALREDDGEFVHRQIRAFNFMMKEGVAGFKLQNPDDARLEIPFGEAAQRLQTAIMTKVLRTVLAIRDWEGPRFVDGNNGGTAPAFSTGTRTGLTGKQLLAKVENDARADGVNVDGEPPVWYVSLDCAQRLALLVQETIDQFPDYTSGLQAHLGRLKETVQQVLYLNRQLQEMADVERQGRAESYLKQQSRIKRGFLNLSNSTIENISVRQSAEFGDRPWDGYSDPCTQHCSGKGAEVTIEIQTGDILLLTQLSDLKESQKALNELRKQKTAVPPLMEVHGDGSMLRCFGIKNMAYRSHTTYMVEDRPGQYRIQINLVQDEDTFINTENWKQISGQLGSNYHHTEELAPLFIPTMNPRQAAVDATPDQTEIFKTKNLRGISALRIMEIFYGHLSEWYTSKGQESKRVFAEKLEGTGITYRDVRDFDISAFQPISVSAGYIPVDERNGRAWEVRFYHASPKEADDNNGGRGHRINVDGLLAPLTSFLDYAYLNPPGGDYTRERFKRLVRAVEESLSTRGLRAGYLLGLLTSASSLFSAIVSDTEMVARQKQRLRDAAEIGVGFGAGRVSNLSEQNTQKKLKEEWIKSYETVRSDNMTLVVGNLLQNLGDSSNIPVITSVAMKRAVDDLSRLVLDDDAYYNSYLAWLTSQNVDRLLEDVEGEQWIYRKTGTDESGPLTIETLPNDGPWPWGQIPDKVFRKANLLDKAGSVAPTCYPDLRMPEIRDATEGMNLMGYDFPFGPGTDSLAEDVYLQDYKQAEQRRLQLAIKFATVGQGVIEDQLAEDEERDLTSEERRRTQRARAKLQQLKQAREDGDVKEFFDTWSGTRLGHAYVDVLKDLQEEAVQGQLNYEGTVGGDLEGTERIDLREDDPQTIAAKQFQKMADYGVFNGRARRRTLLPRDFAAILRATRTLQYAHMLDTKAQLSGVSIGQINEQIKTDLPLGGGPIRERAGLNSNTTNVQQDPKLARMRKELVKLYQDDPTEIASQLGYTDMSAQDERQEVIEKLNDQWTSWIGMRKAFPSYKLLLVGPVGSPFFRLVSDRYSWAAVQQIQIRKDRNSASQTCDLVLSNMRRRLSGPTERYDTALIEAEYEDLSIELSPGRHMQVYVGYGPDVAQLYPFAGRITEVQHGPITRVQLSSYSTTLTNPPEGRSGFQDSGSEGQQLIADLMLKAINETEGLEGLGRDTFSGIADLMGRTGRGSEADFYKVQKIMGLWQALEYTGVDNVTANQETQAKVQNVLENTGAGGGLRTLIQGSPYLYENVKLLSSGPRGYGFTDFVFGGLKEALTGEEGWGWTSDPGQSLWSILKEMALLYPDYIVTTRPYNVGKSMKNLAAHPLRQTLYIGKKDGMYTATSDPKGSSIRQVRSYVQRNLRAVLAKATGTRDTFDVNELLRLYNQYFMPFLMQRLIRILSEQADSWLYEWTIGMLPSWLQVKAGLNSLVKAVAGEGADESTIRAVSILRDELDAADRDVLEQQLSHPKAFPRTVAYWKQNIREIRLKEALAEEYTVTTGYVDEDEIRREKSAWVYFYLWTINAEEVGIAAAGENEEFSLLLEGLLWAFAEDLANQAIAGSRPEQIAEFDMPILDQLRQQAEAAGVDTNPGQKPIRRHFAVNNYTSMIENRIRATDSHPGFANSLTLEWPREADERSSPYLQRSQKQAFTVKASPLLHHDFTVHEHVFFRNMRREWQDEAGIVGAQTQRSDRRPRAEVKREIQAAQERMRRYRDGEIALTEQQLENLQETIDTLRDELNANYTGTVTILEEIQDKKRAYNELDLDGNSSEEALRLRQEIDRLYSELEASNYIKPKYQTVAVNLLQDRLQHMYSGELILPGMPQLEPYHVLHLFDDAEEMFGPVEVDGVMHHFGADGFYTMATPKLLTHTRGADPTIDAMWMDQAGQFYNLYQAVSHGFKGGVLGAGYAAIRAGAIKSLTTKAGGSLAGAGALSRGAVGLLGASAVRSIIGISNPIGWILTIGSILSSYGKSVTEQYAGMMAEITNTNPVMFFPLTRKAVPYVAGLNGAVGPATIRESVAAITSRAREDGRFEDSLSAFTRPLDAGVEDL